MDNNQFLYKGWLYKQSRFLRTWRRRYAVLTKTELLTYKTENVNETPTENIKVSSCKAVKSANDETGQAQSFCIQGDGIEYFFYADTEEEKNRWIGLISEITSQGDDRPCRA